MESRDTTSDHSVRRRPAGDRPYTWGLVFIAPALVANVVFDEPPGEYIAAAFSVVALVLCIVYLVQIFRRRE